MYEDLSSKHSAESVRHRLKYDKLAGKHVELQAEYDSVVEVLESERTDARGAGGQPGSCLEHGVDGCQAKVNESREVLFASYCLFTAVYVCAPRIHRAVCFLVGRRDGEKTMKVLGGNRAWKGRLARLLLAVSLLSVRVEERVLQ